MKIVKKNYKIVVYILVLYLQAGIIYAQESANIDGYQKQKLISGEDPLVKQQQESVPDNISSDIELYGSIRIRYRHVVYDTSEFEDSGSRIGLNSWYEFFPSSWIFARYELGFNLLKELGLDDIPYHHDQNFGNTLFTRLGYIGIQFDKDIVAFGKNWST